MHHLIEGSLVFKAFFKWQNMITADVNLLNGQGTTACGFLAKTVPVIHHLNAWHLSRHRSNHMLIRGFIPGK